MLSFHATLPLRALSMNMMRCLPCAPQAQVRTALVWNENPIRFTNDQPTTSPKPPAFQGILTFTIASTAQTSAQASVLPRSCAAHFPTAWHAGPYPLVQSVAAALSPGYSCPCACARNVALDHISLLCRCTWRDWAFHTSLESGHSCEKREHDMPSLLRRARTCWWWRARWTPTIRASWAVSW